MKRFFFHIASVVIVLIFGCSTKSQLSIGEFDIENSSSFKQNRDRFYPIFPVIEFENDSIISDSLIRGRLYMNDFELLNDIAEELSLKFECSYYYHHHKKDNVNLIKIAENLKEVIFEIPKNPEISDSTHWEVFSVQIKFSNQTHSYDTTFTTSKEYFPFTTN